MLCYVVALRAYASDGIVFADCVPNPACSHAAGGRSHADHNERRARIELSFVSLSRRASAAVSARNVIVQVHDARGSS